MRTAIALSLFAFCTIAAAAQPARLATLPLPGPAAFVPLARDVTDVVFALDPSVASSAGLFDDAVRVPSFAAAVRAKLVERLDRDLLALRRLPWRSWPVDQQIDFRWIYANAETERHILTVEKPFEHRPAQWLEPLANDLIAFLSYAPERPELQRKTLALVPKMLDELRAIAHPTRRDVETAVKLCNAIGGMARATKSPEGAAAAEALARYAAELEAQKPAAEFTVIGPESYAWRLRHALLLPWTPEQLLALAERELARVDGEIAVLQPKLSPLAAQTPAQEAAARELTRAGVLALYDAIEVAHRAATLAGGWVSIPDGVGPIHARETPDAMVPLTGDGGSMNPPPTFATTNVGWWNVEHWKADAPLADKVEEVVTAQGFRDNSMGPYAAHEGFPGHHLQLAIARLHPDPLRSILPDGVENEGWGLYAEEVFWEHGGLGPSLAAHHAVLRSYRYRIARVIYDEKVERGLWSLQQAADFKRKTPPGKGQIDEDLLRAIQWPTQLICYFAGKQQLIQLREDYKKKMGKSYDERAFHDAVLREGSIPLALVRSKLLGEPVPGLDD